LVLGDTVIEPRELFRFKAGIRDDIPWFGHDNRISAIQDRYSHTCPNGTEFFADVRKLRSECISRDWEPEPVTAACLKLGDELRSSLWMCAAMHLCRPPVLSFGFDS